MTHVLRAGYSGPLSLEVFNDVFRQASGGRTAVDAMRSLIALEESVAERLPEATGLAVPPQPVVPTGFAFAELATPGNTRLSELLGKLGFTRTGMHTGKPVELWEQGQARILLNAEGDDPALAAIGLETPDPAGSVKRAESLLSPVLPRHRGPREAPLDAVAAPDGTQLFFCRTAQPDHPSWMDDFDPVNSAPGEITHIDHVALTQPWHHFDEASLFYRSVLGLRPNDSFELADPYGLLRSRAVSDPGGAVRIALNVAYVGSHPSHPDIPWQHVALASQDVITTARRLRDLGAVVLSIPDNYYDDLEARYDLGPERHRTLRDLGLLYDRDERGGEFLHLYTVTVGRIFFEIVQRVGGYQGYGAQNAPIRLAAQHTRPPAEPGASAPVRENPPKENQASHE
jgi:4-hydroxyphenylpyruvate dioxygenase